MSDLSNMTSTQRDPEKIARARELSAASAAAAASASGQATQVALTLSHFIDASIPLDSPVLVSVLDEWRKRYEAATEAGRAAVAAWDEARGVLGTAGPEAVEQ